MDDFKIVECKPEMWLNYIQGAFLVKESGPRKYYLSNDYTYQEQYAHWTYGNTAYTKEAIARVERIFECLAKQSTPLPVTDWHPEMDSSLLLGLEDHRTFQMLLGMLQWVAIICHPDLCCTVVSLNRFGACSRDSSRSCGTCIFLYKVRTKSPDSHRS